MSIHLERKGLINVQEMEAAVCRYPANETYRSSCDLDYATLERK
jgi:hypothetical protein